MAAETPRGHGVAVVGVDSWRPIGDRERERERERVDGWHLYRRQRASVVREIESIYSCFC